MGSLFVRAGRHESRNVSGTVEYPDDLERLGLGKIEHLIRRNVMEAYSAGQQIFSDVAESGVSSQRVEGIEQTLFYIEAPSPATSPLGKVADHDVIILFGAGRENVGH
jgi:hypothetical protein